MHDDPPPHESRLGIGLDLLLLVPVGRLADSTGVLLGPLVRVGYRVVPRLELTFRSGFLFGFDHAQGSAEIPYSTSQNVIPIWAGARYFLLEPRAGLHLDAEVGMNLLQVQFHSDADLPGSTDEAFRARGGFDVGAGWILSEKLPIDFRAQFTYLNVLGTQTGDDPFFGIGVGVGYTLAF